MVKGYNQVGDVGAHYEVFYVVFLSRKVATLARWFLSSDCRAERSLRTGGSW